MLTSKQNMKDGAETQEKADEENQLTSSNIPIPFFKRKRTYSPSARNPLGVVKVKGREEKKQEHDAGEEHNEIQQCYSPKAGFDRTEYELRDTGTGITPNKLCEVSYKSFLISSMDKRRREKAPADSEHDSVQDDCASLNSSIY